MSVFAPVKQEQTKVPNSQYIKTENAAEEGGTKPAEPAKPEAPKAA